MPDAFSIGDPTVEDWDARAPFEMVLADNPSWSDVRAAAAAATAPAPRPNGSYCARRIQVGRKMYSGFVTGRDDWACLEPKECYTLD